MHNNILGKDHHDSGSLTYLTFSFDTLTGRLPSSRVGLIPCSVMTILAFSRKEFSVISSCLRVWALPTKYLCAASLT